MSRVPPFHTVVETPEYLRRAARLLDDVARGGIVKHLAENPRAGVVIPASGGARKLRWAIGGKGKSGGVRVITFFGGATIPVFLLSIFAKNEKADMTPAERAKLRSVLADLVGEYRKGTKRVKGR